MGGIRVSVTLYSVPQALVFLKKHDLKRSDTWLRNRLKQERLRTYRVGRSDFITEADLYKLSLSPKSKRGLQRK